MLSKERPNSGLRVEAGLDLALNVGVFNLLVTLDDSFNLINDLGEGPLGEV